MCKNDPDMIRSGFRQPMNALIENEAKKIGREIIEDNLDCYPTSIKEDEELLKEENDRLMRDIITMRILEKKSIKQLENSLK